MTRSGRQDGRRKAVVRRWAGVWRWARVWRAVVAAAPFVLAPLGASAQVTADTPLAARGQLATRAQVLSAQVATSAQVAASAVDTRDAPPAAEPGGHRGTAVAKYFGGGAVAFAAHEGAHVLFGQAFGATQGVKAVHFGPLPFFAITQSGDLSPRQNGIISAAGFWTQQLTSEVILTRRPNLRREQGPFLKGVLAFDILASVAYAGAAFAEAGPAERDTRGMARRLSWPEPWAGALVLAPALLDTWRYLHPDAAWARWLSRGFKIGGVVLILK